MKNVTFCNKVHTGLSLDISSHPVFLVWISLLSHLGIPGVTLCFCTGSYAAAAAAAVFCPRDNFWTTFWIYFIFGTIVGPDLLITWLDFGRFSSWSWPRSFKVKYGICYILVKNDPIARKQKANISIEFQASNVTNGFDLDHNLDLWIVKVKRDLDLWPHTWPWPWMFMVKF